MQPTILVLNDYCFINGGASKIAIDEAISMADAGQRVIFLGACGPISAELQASKVEVHCLNQPELLNVGKNPGVMLQGLWNFRAHAAMKTLLKKLDAASTVIHLHGYTKALTTSPVRAAVEQGFNVVCTLHDFFAACPNGAQYDYREARPCPRQGLSMDCIQANCDKRHYAHKVYRVARSVIQKYVGELPGGVHHYITLSNRSADILRPFLPADAHYYALENLIETVERPPVDAAANTALVAVGRLDIEKGIEVLLEAVRRTGLPLTLVGEGPLRGLAESVPNCRVTGWVTPEQVQAELEKARCLVFPSLWYETYGLVVAEAASRGIPAIVSDISAASERVENGVHGWHMESGNVDDLVRCLLLTKSDDNIRNAGQSAYQRFWSAPPTRANHIRGLLNIYSKVLQS